MTRKNAISIVKICVLVLFGASLCFVCSCKKADDDATTNQPTTPTTPEQPTVTAEEPEGEEAKEPEPPVVEKPEVEEVMEPETPGEDTAKAGWVPVPLELPKPMFVGTPQDTKVPNLEKPRGGPRPPFLAPEGTENLALNKPVSRSPPCWIC